MDSLPGPKGDKQPWWNDGDKIGGLVATMIMLAVAALLIAGVIKLITMMF